jgi:hypothetical protein
MHKYTVATPADVSLVATVAKTVVDEALLGAYLAHLAQTRRST